MADLKISQLGNAAALDGTEEVEVVQSGVNVKTTTQDIADLGGGGSVTSVSGTSNRITSTGGATPVIDIAAAYDTAITNSLAFKANLASPTFTGTVTIPTPSVGDNTTKAASTAYVVAEIASRVSDDFDFTLLASLRNLYNY